MTATREGHLHVAMNDRGAGSPERIPQQEVVARLLISAVRRFGPAAAGREVVSELRRVHGCDRIVAVENENAVEAIVLGDVARRDRVRSVNTAEGIRRRAGFWMAEGIAFALGDLGAGVVGALRLHRPTRAQIVEERSLIGDTVRDAHDALRADRRYRTEELLDPLPHLLGRL